MFTAASAPRSRFVCPGLIERTGELPCPIQAVSAVRLAASSTCSALRLPAMTAKRIFPPDGWSVWNPSGCLRGSRGSS